jgi:hypothetical protein
LLCFAGKIADHSPVALILKYEKLVNTPVSY